MSKKRWFIVAGLVVAVALGCVAQQVASPGKPKGIFRGTWWGYYERGRSCADAGQLDLALKDFQEAAKLRKDDTRYARTYGVHFTEYFPNREIGCCYFQQGKFKEAKQALEASIKSEPTDKAKYFLEEITVKDILAVSEDKSAPEVAIVFPVHHSDIFINKFDAFVEGEVKDDLRVSKVAVNDQRIKIEPGERTKFSTQLKNLNEGPNPVRMDATDLAGKTTTNEQTVVVDIKGPVPSFKAPMVETTAAGKRVTIQGVVEDDNLLAAVMIGGKEMGGDHLKSLPIQASFDIPAVSDSIPFTATDLAGNQVAGLLSLAATPTPAGAEDKIPPQLGLPPEQMVFFTDLATIDIRAEDNMEVASIEVAGKAVAMKPGTQVFTRQRLPLKEGKNEIPVKITDTSGNVTERVVQVTKYTQSIKTIDAKMGLGVAVLEQEGTDIQVASRVPDKLTSALLTRGRFQVNTAQGTKADAMLQGKVHENKDSIDIVIRVVDPETQTVMGIFDAFEQDKSDATLQFLSDVIAEKMENTFPILEGTVLKAQGDTVILNFPVETTLPKFSRCIVFRPGEEIKDPNTGQVLGSLTEELAEIVIGQSTTKLVQAKIKEKRSPDAVINAGDKVITK